MTKTLTATEQKQLAALRAHEDKWASLCRDCQNSGILMPTHSLTLTFSRPAFTALLSRAVVDGWYRQTNTRLYRKSLENWKHRPIPLVYFENDQDPKLFAYHAWARLPGIHRDGFITAASVAFEPVESYGATLSVEPILSRSAQLEAASDMVDLWQSSNPCRPNLEVPLVLH